MNRIAAWEGNDVDEQRFWPSPSRPLCNDRHGGTLCSRLLIYDFRSRTFHNHWAASMHVVCQITSVYMCLIPLATPELWPVRHNQLTLHRRSVKPVDEDKIGKRDVVFMYTTSSASTGDIILQNSARHWYICTIQDEIRSSVARDIRR